MARDRILNSVSMLAFVLSGGGNRGALQVGALQVLLEAGIRPDMLVGTSVGSVNAAFLACTPTRHGAYRLGELWIEVEKRDVYPGTYLTALWNLLRGRESLFSNKNWYAFLSRHMPVEQFGEVQIPCYAVATDLETGRQFVFGRDPRDRLIDGIMSSTALPPLHPPWTVDGRRYIDGGAVADLPLRVAIDMGATELIALYLANPVTPGEQVRNLLGIVNRAVTALIYRHVEADLEYVRLNSDVKLHTIELRHELSLPPWDFSRSAELIAMGRATMQAALDRAQLQPSTWHDRVVGGVSAVVAPFLSRLETVMSREWKRPLSAEA